MDVGHVLLEVSVLLGGAVLLGLLARRLGLHVSVVLAVVGFLAATLGGSLAVEDQLAGEGFEEVVVAVFLPVLVFEAVLNLSTRDLFRNLLPILALATVALVVSAVVVGLVVHLGLDVPVASALVFGVLISATDPVAVVAVFSHLGVPRRLLALVQGESLLNDAVAIVGVAVLLGAAQGEDVSVAAGLADFVMVFVGGAAVGTALGLAAAAVLPWLDRLAAAALSLAVAYGGFLVAEELLGWSGVMATVAAGVVVGALAESRASEDVRATWHRLWESLDFVANSVLFLLIGLLIDADLLVQHLGGIALAVAAVLVARPLAVVPIVGLLQRVAGIPPVGRRNQAVLVWGGLRGGVALALALALPEGLPHRELFVAMAGGVVLTTLIVNATTISPLVRRLGLDRPSRTERFLTSGARLSAVDAARERLAALDIDDDVVSSRLDALGRAARQELAAVELSGNEQLQVVVGRALAMERHVYGQLRDAGMLPPTTTRLLLHEVDDALEEVALGRAGVELVRRGPHVVDRAVQRVVAVLPSPVGEDPGVLAYAEASARRLAARRIRESLALLRQLPNISGATIAEAGDIFRRSEAEADATLAELDAADGTEPVRRRQAVGLTQVASLEALHALADVGLLPRSLAEEAAEAVAHEAAAAVAPLPAQQGSEARPVDDRLRRSPKTTR